MIFTLWYQSHTFYESYTAANESGSGSKQKSAMNQKKSRSIFSTFSAFIKNWGFVQFHSNNSNNILGRYRRYLNIRKYYCSMLLEQNTRLIFCKSTLHLESDWNRRSHHTITMNLENKEKISEKVSLLSVQNSERIVRKCYQVKFHFS